MSPSPKAASDGVLEARHHQHGNSPSCPDEAGRIQSAPSLVPVDNFRAAMAQVARDERARRGSGRHCPPIRHQEREQIRGSRMDAQCRRAPPPGRSRLDSGPRQANHAGRRPHARSCKRRSGHSPARFTLDLLARSLRDPCPNVSTSLRAEVVCAPVWPARQTGPGSRLSQPGSAHMNRPACVWSS